MKNTNQSSSIRKGIMDNVAELRIWIGEDTDIILADSDGRRVHMSVEYFFRHKFNKCSDEQKKSYVEDFSYICSTVEKMKKKFDELGVEIPAVE